MSFEGSYAYVCPSGHFWSRDISYLIDDELCPICSLPPEHDAVVDETNGLPYYLSFYIEYVDFDRQCVACGTLLPQTKYIFHKLPYLWECKDGNYILGEGNIPERYDDELE
jgi:hypothetical protein